MVRLMLSEQLLLSRCFKCRKCFCIQLSRFGLFGDQFSMHAAKKHMHAGG